MLVVDDRNYQAAVHSLKSAELLDPPWSFFACEPEFYQGKGPMFQNIERNMAQD